MKTIKEDIFNTGYGSPYDYEEDYRACDWCEEEFPVSALTKTDGGWVCPQCIEEAESHGEPFTVFSGADYYSELQEAINNARANKSKINKKLRESKALNEKWLIEARTKPWTAEEIKNILYKNDDQVGKALVQLWERQEDDEKASKTTSHKNSSGFNAFDAEILSSFAEFYSTHNRLSPKQLFIARKRIMKYAKQLADIANEALLAQPVSESLNESIEDYLAKILAGEVAVPMDVNYISQGKSSGDIQFNGITYGFLKNEDGTYTILSPTKDTIAEDFVNDGVNRKVKTPQEIEKELSELSNNFTEQDIMLRTELEDEKTLAANILKKHYSTVEISDGRTTKEEHMSWVVTAAGPFKDFAEDYDDNIGDYLKEEIQLNESDVEFVERYKNHGIYFVDNKYTWESSDFTYLTDTSLEGLKAQIDEYDEQYNHYFHNLYEAK